MNLRSLLRVVPKAVRLSALLVAFATFLAGCITGWFVSGAIPDPRVISLYVLAALVAAGLLGTWLLGIGFVFADAKRRRMRPWLWTLVVILFPHLLGFLLYFVMRQPLASVCSACGQTVSPTQPFCSWCGAPQPALPLSSNVEATR